MSKPSAHPNRLRETVRSLDNYWFGRGSPTTLGVFRILIGTLCFANWILLGLHWESWFSERGYVPAWLGQVWLKPTVPIWWGGYELPRLDLINGVTDPRITLPFFLLIGVFSVLTACGLWTRFSSAILAILVVSLHHRNAAILHGGDSVLRISVIYLAVAPCGLGCSMDRLIGLWRGRISSAEPVLVSLWSQRVICFNVALVYFTTTWLKFDGARWRDGIATFYPARLAEFYRFPVPPFANNLPFVWISTYATLATEFSLGTLVFFRNFRKYVLIAGILMHGYIDYSMNIPLFSYLMCSSYISFYDGDEVDAWAFRMGRRLSKFRVTIYVPKGKQLADSSAKFLHAVDPFRLVTFALGSEEGWSATRSNGTAIRTSFALWSRCPGTYLLGLVPNLLPNLLKSALEKIASRPPTTPHTS